MMDLEAQLKTKRICRFCLNQDEKVLSNLYSRENRLKNSAPLPLQVMACVSIEVFTNDGMPSTVCDQCRMLMDHCYRFKQMCKKAETALKQFPLTGKWPEKLEHPQVPEELISNKKNINIPSDVIKREMKTSIESPTQDQNIQNINKTITNAPKQKILNKNPNPVKILNKDAAKAREPVLKQPVIKHSKDGTIELVTEIIDTDNYEEIDPIKSAEPIETNVFPCTHCERSFPLRQLLDIHMVNHNRERNFQCDSCEKKFFTKYDLGKHALIHQNDKPYKCVVCVKSFTRANLLLRHERIHTDIPKFLCVHCEKPFISKEELQKHTERHNKKRPFACKLCDKSFAFKQGLERHEVLHGKEQPFPCQYCHSSFPTPSKLSRHLTAHAGARPYPCKFCSKSFLLSHHLSRHLRSHREGSGALFKCYDCDQTFTSRDNLIYHSAVHATQTLLCPICKEQFDDIDSVTEHIKAHALGEQYACEFCDLIFMTQEKLDNHCTLDHVEEMDAYNEHDKSNVKKQKRLIPQEVSDSEIIQEFVIQEFDEPIIKEEIVIEENNFEMEENLPSPIPVKKPRGRKKKIVEKFEPIIEDTNDRSYSSHNDIDFDDFTAEETALFEELLEEPPTKLFKRDRDEIEQSKPKFKQSPKQALTPKMKQTVLPTIVHTLPKGITIKKENKKNVKVIDETIICESDTIKKDNIQPDESSPKTKKILNKSNEGNKKVSEKSETINIGNKRIQVKKIQVTKAQVELMAKQGKINFNKDGSMSIKHDPNKNRKK